MFEDLSALEGVFVDAARYAEVLSSSANEDFARGREVAAGLADGLLEPGALAPWVALPPHHARVAWLTGLCRLLSGAGCLSNAAHEEVACDPVWDGPPRAWLASTGVLRLLAALARLASSARPPPATLARLAGLRADAVRWIRPPGCRSRAARGPAMSFLFQCTGWALMAALTRHQADGSRAEQATSRRRLAALPRPVACALAAPTPDSVLTMAQWITEQAMVLVGAASAPAGVYMLTTLRTTYVGLTSQQGRLASGRGLGMPSTRGWQHWVNVWESSAPTAAHRTALFRRDPGGYMAWCLVAVGGVHSMATLERTVIRQLAPPANTSQAVRGGWRRPEMPRHALPPPPGPSAHAARGRARPPPHMRASAAGVAAAPQGLGVAQTRIPQELRKHLAREALRRDRIATLAAADCHYDAAYLLSWRMGRAPIGPQDLASAAHIGLLASLVGTRGSEVPWDYILLRGGTHLFYALGALILRLRRSGRALLARRRWGQAARRFAAIPWSLPVLPAPSQMGPGPRRVLVRAAAQALSDGDPSARRWAGLRLRGVSAPVDTWGRRLMRMGQVCKAYVVEELIGDSARHKAARAGEDMRRRKVCLSVPVWHDRAGVLRQVRDSLEAWRRALPREAARRVDAAPAAVWADSLSGVVAASAADYLPDRYRLYLTTLPRPPPGRIIVVEDKDPSAGWEVDAWSHGVRSLDVLLRDGVWRMLGESPESSALRTAALYRDPAVAPFVRRVADRD